MPRAAAKKNAAAIAIQLDQDKATVRVSPTKKKRNAAASTSKKAIVTRIDSDEGEEERAKVEAAIHRQALLDNFDAEIQERRLAIEKRIKYVLVGLRRECQSQLALLPPAVADLSVAEYSDVYAFSLDLASRGIARRKNEASMLELPINERLERGLASARKRKHGDALPTPTLSQADPGSPLPMRPAKRTTPAPIVPTSKAAISQTLARSTRSRATSPPAAKAQSSSSQGFVYRARPSLLARDEVAARSPVIPKSPVAASGRRPRRNESIQAYSLNGSPLGLLAIERDDEGISEVEMLPPARPAPPPTGDFTFSVALPASVVAQLREQLEKTVMAEEDKLKLQRILDGQPA